MAFACEKNTILNVFMYYNQSCTHLLMVCGVGRGLCKGGREQETVFEHRTHTRGEVYSTEKCGFLCGSTVSHATSMSTANCRLYKVLF